MKSTRFAAFTSSSSSLSSPSSSSEGAGLVVGSITSLAGDAVAHTGLEEPSCLSGFNQREVTWFQHRGSSTAPVRLIERGYHGAASVAVSAPSAGRSGAVHNSALFCWGGGIRAQIPARSGFIFLLDSAR